MPRTTKAPEVVPCAARVAKPPVSLSEEQIKFLRVFGSFARQARDEGCFGDFFSHVLARWWVKWPVDYPSTATSIAESRTVSHIPVLCGRFQWTDPSAFRVLHSVSSGASWKPRLSGLACTGSSLSPVPWVHSLRTRSVYPLDFPDAL